MISGPMCCCILADQVYINRNEPAFVRTVLTSLRQGADVIKVEPLAGEGMRAMAKGMSSTFSTVNRNKR